MNFLTLKAISMIILVFIMDCFLFNEDLNLFFVNSQNILNSSNQNNNSSFNNTNNLHFIEKIFNSVKNLSSDDYVSYVDKLIQYNNTKVSKYVRSKKDKIDNKEIYNDLLFIEAQYFLSNKTAFSNSSIISNATMDLRKSFITYKIYWFVPNITHFQNTYILGLGTSNYKMNSESNKIPIKYNQYNYMNANLNVDYDYYVCKINFKYSVKKCHDYYLSYQILLDKYTYVTDINTTFDEYNITIKNNEEFRDNMPFNNFTDLIKNFTLLQNNTDVNLGGRESIINFNVEDLITKYISPYKGLIIYEFKLPLFSNFDRLNQYYNLSQEYILNKTSNITDEIDQDQEDSKIIDDKLNLSDEFLLFGNEFGDLKDVNFDFHNNITVFYGRIDNINETIIYKVESIENINLFNLFSHVLNYYCLSMIFYLMIFIMFI